MALLEFYGDTCPHCIAMKPLVADLEKDLGISVEQYEVWNNPENQKKLEEVDVKGECGGVPFFYNTDTKRSVCGSTEYHVLKAWAEGKEA